MDAWCKERGFQLGAMGGDREKWDLFGGRRVLVRMLRRMALLAEGLFALDLEVHVSRPPTHVTATVNRRRERLGLIPETAAATIEDSLSPFLAQLNAVLHEEGISHRFAIYRERSWFGCCVHLLPRTDVPPFFQELALEAAEAAKLPRLPRLREVVPRSRLYESDFKCSARPSDVTSLLEEIAGFARLAEIGVGLTTTKDGASFDAVISDGRHRSSTRIANEKYVDVRPVLSLFDQALARRSDPHRLYRCFGDGFEDAVARATPDEAKLLAKLSFLENPYEMLEGRSGAGPA